VGVPERPGVTGGSIGGRRLEPEQALFDVLREDEGNSLDLHFTTSAYLKTFKTLPRTEPDHAVSFGLIH